MTESDANGPTRDRAMEALARTLAPTDEDRAAEDAPAEDRGAEDRAAEGGDPGEPDPAATDPADPDPDPAEPGREARLAEREADLARRARSLAGELDRTQGLRARLEAERAEYARSLQPLIQRLGEEVSQEETELARLSEEGDAQAWLRAHTRMQNRRAALSQAEEGRRRLAEAARAEAEAARERRVETAREALRAALPQLAEPAAFDAELADLRRYLGVEGFDGRELAALDLLAAEDHRLTLIARKAMLYDRLQKSRPEARKKVAKAAKAVRPGTVASPDDGQAGRMNRSLDALRRNPRSREAGVAALAERLAARS